MTGAELEQARNFSRKFWLDQNNAPSEETLKVITTALFPYSAYAG